MCDFIDILITIGPIDNQWKCGGFNRQRNLRDEKPLIFKSDFFVGGAMDWRSINNNDVSS